MSPKTMGILGGLVLVASVGAFAWMGMDAAERPTAVDPPDAEVARTASVQADLPTVTVWKTETCGCCGDWVEHLKENGFDVEVENVTDLARVKRENELPPDLVSCHTAVVGGYVVEGHVPADAIRDMLAQRPDLAGIAVPGMPVGSPGMEVPGRPADAYDVIGFTEDGERSVFRSY